MHYCRAHFSVVLAALPGRFAPDDDFDMAMREAGPSTTARGLLLPARYWRAFSLYKTIGAVARREAR